MDDPFDLQRFIDAQAPIYGQALGEISAGRKRSHWMWFIFPQFAGLGSSSMSQRHAVQSLDEARGYLAHPVLGPRLIECAEAVLTCQRSASEIFGYPDDLKLRSSATLFEAAAGEGSVFARLIEQLFDGRRDEATLKLLVETV